MEAVLWTLFLVTSLVAMATSAPPPLGPVIIDLSYKLNNATVHMPRLGNVTVTPFRRTPRYPITRNAKFNVTGYDVISAEHMGTHMDAPSQFHDKGMTIDELPLDKVMGDAVVVNMSAKAAKDPDARLTRSDLEAWEREHGRIPDNAILLLHTGWGRYWGDAARYLGGEGNDRSNYHFPGIHIEAAKWLVEKRHLKMYGVDAISIDQGRSMKVHTLFGKNNIPAVENVANLDKLPAKGALVYAAPMNIEGGGGAFVRMFAIINI